MSKEDMPGAADSEKEPRTTPPARPQPIRSSSIPVLLSILALLLAAFALSVALTGNKNMVARQPLDDIKEELTAMRNRVNHMEALMATDKRELVQTELKRMLLNLHELSRLGDNKTRSEISKAEAVLLRLSTPKTRVKAQVDLKSTEKAAQSAKKKTPAAAPVAPEPVKKPPTQKLQTTQTSKKTLPEHNMAIKPAPKTAAAKPAKKPKNKTANTPVSAVNTKAMPVSPVPGEK